VKSIQFWTSDLKNQPESILFLFPILILSTWTFLFPRTFRFGTVSIASYRLQNSKTHDLSVYSPLTLTSLIDLSSVWLSMFFKVIFDLLLGFLALLSTMSWPVFFPSSNALKLNRDYALFLDQSQKNFDYFHPLLLWLSTLRFCPLHSFVLRPWSWTQISGLHSSFASCALQHFGS
jgi:hypothetical protein